MKPKNVINNIIFAFTKQILIINNYKKFIYYV